ncbi:cobalamin-binding protein [Thalassotalea sediminis]|uniref:cobalamin-binding protein n=1 Tax=Thalassotalea sediminis TaxID=1759089 RepID=UPI00257381AE|nr:cobalamin-binding protein [Thalassotalea sediminis]
MNMNTMLLSLFVGISVLVSVNAAHAEESIDKPAKRIIALAPHIVENLFQIGAGDLIIGTTDHADFPLKAKNIPRVGNYATLSIEKILAANPDLIIAWKSGNPADDLARLATFGIPIVYSNPTTLEDVAKELRDLGQWTGLSRSANQQADKYLAQLATLKETYQNATPISLFYELWPRPLTTIAKNAWLQQQIQVCGATNPFKESKTDYPQINIEQVIIKAPQIIIQPSSHGNQSPDKINWQQWPDMPAVKNNAFIHPNADMLYRMTSRSLDELSSLCELIDKQRK